MNVLNKAYSHFKTITTHKILVMQGCFKLGLYKQGLLHDLSKYTFTEFITGIKYYQGYRSPNSAEVEAIGYSTAWLHHKGRNKHHFEYWVDFAPRDKEKPLRIAPMPDKYICEMLVDRVVACKVYHKNDFKNSDPLDYYYSGNTAQFLHPKTQKMLEGLLKMYSVKGEEFTYRYIRKKILHNIL